jgi:DNA-binding GntR family transcriptional regulator
VTFRNPIHLDGLQASADVDQVGQQQSFRKHGMPSRNGDNTAVTLSKSRDSGPRLVPSLLKTRAYDELRSRIVNNEFPPGSFLAERQLAKQLGMSKTPVKAALERLQLEGFINISPQQGIVVRDLTVHEIADQYELRGALEAYILRTLAGRLNDEQIERLRANLRLQESILGRNEVRHGVAYDTEFHLLLTEFLGNQEIRRIMVQLRDRMQRIITRVFQLNPGRIDSSYREHVAIAEALIDGDGERAAQMLTTHLELGRSSILAPRSH